MSKETETLLMLPDGTSVKYSYKTLEKWKSLYSTGGLDALMPVSRADKGTSRSLNDEAVAEIYRIKKEYPRMNTTQIHERLVQESFILATVSVDSVQRFIRHNDLKISQGSKSPRPQSLQLSDCLEKCHRYLWNS